MNRMKQRIFCIAVLMGYILGCHQGQIALWKENMAQPVQIYPYRVTSLPPADQQALREGIHADTELELAQLLEDYLS